MFNTTMVTKKRKAHPMASVYRSLRTQYRHQKHPKHVADLPRHPSGNYCYLTHHRSTIILRDQYYLSVIFRQIRVATS